MLAPTSHPACPAVGPQRCHVMSHELPRAGFDSHLGYFIWHWQAVLV